MCGASVGQDGRSARGRRVSDYLWIGAVAVSVSVVLVF